MEHVFKSKYWNIYCYDGRRKKFFLNKTKEQFASDKEKHHSRQILSLVQDNLQKTRFAKVKSDLEYFSNIPYTYQGDGYSDWQCYQRPSSNGIGWVAICPGERGNNYYVDDPITVTILKRRYQNYINNLKK